MNDYIDDTFQKIFTDRVHLYSQIFKRNPLKGACFEELFAYSLEQAHGELVTVVWKPNSHGVGADITANGDRISLKSIRLRKNQSILEYGSYRTTSLKTLPEKLSYIDLNHYDRLICLSRVHIDTSIVYSLREIFHDVVYSELHWEENDINYVGRNTEKDVLVHIRKSMSDQLRVFVPMTSTKELFQVTVNLNG